MIDVYQSRRWEYLVDLNRYITKKISSMLGINTEFLDSKTLFEAYDEATMQMATLVERLGGTEYLSGPSARSYMAGYEHVFADKGIKLIYKDYGDFPEYDQLTRPFEPQVSIVDMMANIQLEKVPDLIWGWRSESPNESRDNL